MTTKTRRVGYLSTSEAEKAIANLTGWSTYQVNNVALRMAQDAGECSIADDRIHVIADDDTQTYTLVITEDAD